MPVAVALAWASHAQELEWAQPVVEGVGVQVQVPLFVSVLVPVPVPVSVSVSVSVSVPVPTPVPVPLPVPVIEVLIGHLFSGESPDAAKTCLRQSET